MTKNERALLTAIGQGMQILLRSIWMGNRAVSYNASKIVDRIEEITTNVMVEEQKATVVERKDEVIMDEGDYEIQHLDRYSSLLIHKFDGREFRAVFNPYALFKESVEHSHKFKSQDTDQQYDVEHVAAMHKLIDDTER